MPAQATIITRVAQPLADRFAACLSSVRQQNAPDWQHVIIVDGSHRDVIREILDAHARDPRVAVRHEEHSNDFAATSARALESSDAPLVMLLGQHDELAPAAITELSAACPPGGAAYGDHERIGPLGEVGPPLYKPDFSPELLRNTNYISRPLLVSRDALTAAGGFGTAHDHDHDFVLRLTEAATDVVHVPGILYRWFESPPVSDDDRRAVAEHCARVGIDASVEATDQNGCYRLRRTVASTPLVSVIIPTRGSSGRVWGVERSFVVQAVASLVEHSTHQHLEFVIVHDDATPDRVLEALHRVAGDRLRLVPFSAAFNFSEKVNVGVEAAAGDLLLVLNDDTELIEPQSIATMVAHLDAQDVAMVGAKLLFADGTLQHGGHVYHGAPMHACLGWHGDSPGPLPLRPLAVERECSGVTAAAALVRRSVFESVGGFSEDFALNYNDVDFCLKVRAAGHRILWTPYACWYHYESQTRDSRLLPEEVALLDERWHDEMQADPYLNPYLHRGRHDWLEMPPMEAAPNTGRGTNPLVPVVVVTHAGQAGRLRSCIDALAHAGGAGPLIVVDNSQVGGEGDQAWPTLPDLDVVVIRTSNRGYGAAANVGFEHARRLRPDSTVVALLNDDVIVTPGWLAPLVDAVEEGWDVVQPKLLSSSPGLASGDRRIVNSVGVALDRYHAGTDIGHGQADGPSFDGTASIDIFTGGALLATTDFLDATGGFDERYFLYYEDVDLALRGRELGRRYACAAGSVVWHEGGASTSALGDDLRRLQERNRLWCAVRFADPVTVARAYWLTLKRLRHQPRRAHGIALTQGLLGGFVRGAERAVAAGRQRRVPASSDLVHDGINLLGYHRSASGLGTAARELRRSFEAAGVPVSLFDVDATHSPELQLTEESGTANVIRPVTVAVVTALELPAALAARPQLAAVDKVIGYWFWELADVPDAHRPGIELVDEIWAPTKFVLDAYSAVPDAPLVVLQPLLLPEPALDEAEREAWRQRLAPHDEFVFLVTLDLFSIVERKNPFGAIDAFATAFGGRAEAGPRSTKLVIKTLNGERRPESLGRIAHHVARSGVADQIEIIDAFVSGPAMTAIVAAADCLVSLHRGEGLGLHLADAMWLGTPVIASRYSGNLDFMDDDCAALIDVTMTEVEHGEGAYPDDFHWAEPNVAQAASWMTRLVTDDAARTGLASAAKRRMVGQPTEADLGSRYAAALAPQATRSAD